MKELRLLAVVAVFVVVGELLKKAHPAAELPPIVQDLEHAKTEFRTDLDNLEQRLDEHIDDVHSLKKYWKSSKAVTRVDTITFTN